MTAQDFLSRYVELLRQIREMPEPVKPRLKATADDAMRRFKGHISAEGTGGSRVAG